MRRSKRLLERASRRLKACIKIQTIFRNYLKSLPVDPITQDTLELPLLICTENGKRYYFGAEVISEYILKTGDVRNPLTRREFERDVIKDLEKLTNKKIFSKLAIAREKRKREREIASVHEYFEGIIYDFLSDIIDECCRVDTTVLQKVVACKIKMRVGLFPAFFSYMTAIKTNHPDSWEEMCNEKMDRLIANVDAKLLSNMYYEEVVLEEIKYDITHTIPPKIVLMRDD